jgi:ankyrin repeat protein
MKRCIILVGCLICLRALALEPAPPGSTPLHRAALRGDVDAVAALIKAGANVNATNAVGATPLHYAVGNEPVVELLLGAGANPNALSGSRFTPLFSAAARQDSYGSVKRLLAAGALVDLVSYSEEVGVALTPLTLAVFSGDERTAALLLEHGASAAISNSIPVAMAAYTGRERLLKLLVEHGGSVNCSDNFAGHALNIALYAQHRQLVPYLLTQGIDLHQKSLYGSEGVPPMVWPAYDETGDPSAALALLEHGVDINEPSSSGSTALSWALKRGNTRLVELLRSKGATEESKGLKKKAVPSHALPSDTAGQDRMLRDGVQRALGLLQRSSDGFLDNGFVKKSGCVSCHQQTLSAVAFARARERGFQLDETSLARQLTVQQFHWSKTRDAAYEMQPPQPDPPIVIGYGLQGLHALGYQPDELTAAMSWYLAETQLPDGSWPGLDFRPPMEAGQIMGTALTVKALQKDAPAYESRPVQERIAAARRWLEQCQPPDLTQRVFRYLGLGWAGATPSDLQSETRDLLSLQRPDGGWAALPALESDAWATGLTLAALHEVGGLVASHSAYRRGVEFLLRTQFEDGS